LLPPSTGADMDISCPTNYGGASDRSKCKIDWGKNSSKVIVLATDEDSDLPTNVKYQMTGQASKTGCSMLYDKKGAPVDTDWMIEPLFYPSVMLPLNGVKNTKTYYRTGNGMTLDNGFQQEIDHTAKLLSSSDVMLISLISQRPGTEDSYFRQFVSISAFNKDDSEYFAGKSNLIPDQVTVVTYQFGHPDYQSHLANYSNFKSDKTKISLEQNGFGKSLQAQVIGLGGYMRVFDLDVFATSSNKVSLLTSFYSELVREVVTV